MKKNIGLISAVIAVIINIFILIWGLNINGGDEIGYSLIAFYALMPITSLVTCIIMSRNRFRGAIPVAVILSVAAFLIPYAVFSSFDWISVFFGLIPCAIGLLIGYALKKINLNRRNIDTRIK